MVQSSMKGGLYQRKLLNFQFITTNYKTKNTIDSFYGCFFAYFVLAIILNDSFETIIFIFLYF
jgi:hypothetical protein